MKSKKRRAVVVLAIEVDDDEKHPSQWIWSSILDPTRVITTGFIDVADDATEDEICDAIRDGCEEGFNI